MLIIEREIAWWVSVNKTLILNNILSLRMLAEQVANFATCNVIISMRKIAA